MQSTTEKGIHTLEDARGSLTDVYEIKCAGGGGEGAGSQPMIRAVHTAHGAQINFGDPTQYLKLWKTPQLLSFPISLSIFLSV